MAVRKATGRMLGRGRAAPGRCAAALWAALAARMGGTWSRLRAVRRTARRPTSGPPEGHGLDAGQWPSSALCCPGRLCGCLCVQLGHNQRPAQCFKSAHVCGFWALLAERVGGHLVPAPGGHLDVQTAHQRAGQKAAGPDAWQRSGSSGAARYTSLGVSGRAGGRHLVTAPGGQEDGQTGRQWAARGPRAGRWAEARRLQGGALRRPGWLWQ